MEATPNSGELDDANSKRVVSKHRIHCDESYGEQSGPASKARPYRIEKGGEALELYKYHFGKTWDAFERWVKAKELAKHPPHEIYIASVMSYWWESTRDLIARLRRLMGNKPRIIIGGIYPSIAPDHAARYTGADIVVAGEVHEANDLWTDLSVYRNKPTYAIITPSRGCPYNCHYCAAKTINNGIQQVRFRSVDDIFAEMVDKHERFGIRDFALYADFLLIKFQDNLIPLLRKIVDAKKPWRLLRAGRFGHPLPCQFAGIVRPAQSLALPENLPASRERGRRHSYQPQSQARQTEARRRGSKKHRTRWFQSAAPGRERLLPLRPAGRNHRQRGSNRAVRLGCHRLNHPDAVRARAVNATVR